MPSPSESVLSAALKELMANLYVMYLRAHGAHWNVEGMLFAPLHKYFGQLYEDVFESIDPIAEALRQHDVYAPYTLSHVAKLATIADAQLVNGQPTPLLQDLVGVNSQVQTSLAKAFRAAESAGDLGLANILQDRMAAHLKHAWQLRAHLKNFD